MQLFSKEIQFRKNDLIKLYELMYKWGWIQEHYRKEGWLSDSVVALLRRLEPELNSYLTLGLSALAYEFEGWLEHHSQYLSYPVEDDEDLQLDYAKDFLEENSEETTTGFTNNEQALEYIDSNNMFDEYLVWLKNNTIQDNEYDAAYARISDAQDMVYLFVNSSDIPDKIEAFNAALMTEHTGGIMSENISQSFPEITKELLDALSAGAYTEKWNKDLKQFGIKAMKKRVCADVWGWEEEIPGDQDFDLSYFTNTETQLVSDFIDNYYVSPITKMVKSLSRRNNTETDIINAVSNYLRKEISSSIFRGREVRDNLITQALNSVDWNVLVLPYINMFSGPEFLEEYDELSNLETVLNEFSPQEQVDPQEQAQVQVAPKSYDPKSWTYYENTPEWTYTV